MNKKYRNNYNDNNNNNNNKFIHLGNIKYTNICRR